MTDVGFPVIRYEANATSLAWGEMHGALYRDAIRELVEIRRSLMAAKNPQLRGERVRRLAQQQWHLTSRYDADLAEELTGIARGAAIAVEDLVVLNNYTDFRDIQIGDEGCSTVYIHRGSPMAGQTWDMHRSAKRFVCVLDIPAPPGDQRIRAFSVVGCVGMMGFHTGGRMIGVNNINTNGARAGVLWPVLVRKVLLADGLEEMEVTLQSAPVTSGHAYLVAAPQGAAFWEVMPDLAERVEALLGGAEGHLFHTNHCLGEQAKKREIVESRSATTEVRYGLLKKKVGAVHNLKALYDLLNDHENYPQSICSNYQATAVDPSITCGGAAGDLATGEVVLWRGDPVHDANFVRRDFGSS